MEQVDPELYREAQPIVVVVSRKNVETGNFGPTLEILNSFKDSPEKTRTLREKVELCFEGYDNSNRELYEIPAVREFVAKLDKEFPYWLYFLSKHFTGLQCIIHCLLTPNLTLEPNGANELNKLLFRWFSAVNDLIEKAGLSEELNEHLTEKVVQYITEGPFPIGE